jgi:prepilin-type N-terminal cleavage/methylation domain-containing protein
LAEVPIIQKRYFRQMELADMQLVMDTRGFTMIEVVAVMVIMGVMASLSLQKLDLVSHTATNRVIESGLRELNTRETLVWTQIKLSDSGWVSDSELFSKLDTDLGHDFKWTTAPNASGGILQFRSKSISLTRTASSSASVGYWH